MALILFWDFNNLIHHMMLGLVILHLMLLEIMQSPAKKPMASGSHF